MFLSFSGAMAPAGWLVMLLIWAALIAAVVWGITRLFPDRNEATVAAPPRQRQGDDAEPPLVESGRAEPAATGRARRRAEVMGSARIPRG